MDKTINDPQSIANISCGRWWGSHSQAIPITEYPVTLTYHNCSQKNADMNWHSPAAVIFYSKDGCPGPEASKGAPNHYLEYAIVRSDAYAWKTQASHIQYESLRTSRWKTWDVWREENKAGVSCTVTAVRVQSWVRIRMENAGQIVTATITLPAKAPDTVYLSMTGELCTMTDFKLFRESEPIEAQAIRPKDFEKTFIPKKKGDIPNIDCAGWWTAHSDGILLEEGTKVHVSFGSISYPNSKETWHSAFVVLYSSLNQLVNGAAYREFSVTRDDGYGWNSEGDNYKVTIALEDSFLGWDQWLARNEAGVTCDLYATLSKGVVIIELQNSGAVTVSSTSIPANNKLPIYVALSGELCAITDIHITRQKI